jgi:hypothetical protein
MILVKEFLKIKIMDTEFIESLNNKPKGWVFNMPFVVDFINNGKLTIVKLDTDCSESDCMHHKWKVRFSYVILSYICVEQYFQDIQSMLNYISNMKTSKFVGSELFLPTDEYQEYTNIYENIMKLTNSSLDTCYVCHENNYGFKTECGHDICVKCFYKSCKRSSVNSNKFKCGLCRHVVLEETDDYYDSDDD